MSAIGLRQRRRDGQKNARFASAGNGCRAPSVLFADEEQIAFSSSAQPAAKAIELTGQKRPWRCRSGMRRRQPRSNCTHRQMENEALFLQKVSSHNSLRLPSPPYEIWRFDTSRSRIGLPKSNRKREAGSRRPLLVDLGITRIFVSNPPKPLDSKRVNVFCFATDLPTSRLHICS